MTEGDVSHDAHDCRVHIHYASSHRETANEIHVTIT